MASIKTAHEKEGPMDFTSSEQYERVREVAAQVAREVVAPRAAAVDEEGIIFEDTQVPFRVQRARQQQPADPLQ